jgi:hypothetical protein
MPQFFVVLLPRVVSSSMLPQPQESDLSSNIVHLKGPKRTAGVGDLRARVNLHHVRRVFSLGLNRFFPEMAEFCGDDVIVGHRLA